MKKRKKFLYAVLLLVCCMFFEVSNTSAWEPVNSGNDWSVFSGISTRATRHNFNLSVPLWSTKTDMQSRDTGNFKYIRVRIEPATSGSDNIEFRAVGGFIANTPEVRLATKTISIKASKLPAIIDFKAPNATCRSDATYCVDCAVISGYSSNDYCAIATSNSKFGIQVYNGAILAGTQTVVGGYSLEN